MRTIGGHWLKQWTVGGEGRGEQARLEHLQPHSRGDVAYLRTCGPFLILSPALKRWEFLQSPKTTLGRKLCTMSGVVGKKHGMFVIRPPYTCASCNCKRYLWCTHCSGCACLFGYYRLPARGGLTRDTHLWVHHPADQEPTTPPTVAHDNDSNTAPVVRTPARPKKQCKVRFQAHTSVPTTTQTTRSGHLKKPPPPKDGGYLSEGDATPEVHKE